MATAGNITVDYDASGQDARGVMAPLEPLTRTPSDEKVSRDSKTDLDVRFAEGNVADDDQEGEKPTEEERLTLRLVAGSIPLAAYVICLVEFAERASYYGCSNIFGNFIQRPLPFGSTTGASLPGTETTPGALGLGLQAATGITKTFSFLAYILPIAGGILADTKWGKYKTICVGTAVGVVAHVLLVISALPSVIATGHAVAPFIISVLMLAAITGLVKPCIAPLLADQSSIKHQRVITLESGERVIVDPSATLSKILGTYYWAVNVGAVFSIATTYCEKRVGFWLAWLVPGILYMLMPICLWWVRKRLIHIAPQGSVVVDAVKVTKLSFTKGGVRHFIKGDQEQLWNKAKPSQMAAYGIVPKREGWVNWDDDFVDELKRAVKACKLFLFFPIFLMADGGMDTVIASMGGSMTTAGAPNDLLQSFNSITIIFAVPLMNFYVYPMLRRNRINFSPVRRIIFGFGLAVISMIVCAILQWRVYETSPCGYAATECVLPDGSVGVSPISIWAQIPLYSLPAMAEIFINVTSYELAITRAPQRMKGLVFAICLSMSSLSSALTIIITPALADPNLIWPPVGIACANAVAMVLIWIFFRKMDDDVEVLEIGVDRKIESEIKDSQVGDQSKKV